MQEQYIETLKNGTTKYYKDKDKTILHREDGPAIEHADGSKLWYVDDKRHRTDGPAVEWADGSKVWHVNGKLHRLDGPAIDLNGGDRSWYVNGVFIMMVDRSGQLINKM